MFFLFGPQIFSKRAQKQCKFNQDSRVDNYRKFNCQNDVISVDTFEILFPFLPSILYIDALNEKNNASTKESAAEDATETSKEFLFFTIFPRFHLIVLEFAPTAFTSAFWGHGRKRPKRRRCGRWPRMMSHTWPTSKWLSSSVVLSKLWMCETDLLPGW